MTSQSKLKTNNNICVYFQRKNYKYFKLWRPVLELWHNRYALVVVWDELILNKLVMFWQRFLFIDRTRRDVIYLQNSNLLSKLTMFNSSTKNTKYSLKASNYKPLNELSTIFENVQNLGVKMWFCGKERVWETETKSE